MYSIGAMKSAGLSSTFRNRLKHTTKTTAFATLQENHLAAKEKQKSLRLQAERAQLERQKRERLLSSEGTTVERPLK